jgi:precorrin-6B methylase 2
MKRLVKRLLLPTGWAPRRVPFGLARGITLEVDFAHETRMYLGLYELEIARHIRRLCRRGMVCFDIGGQYGWHALTFAKLGAKVVTFEPDAEVLQRLRRNLELNPELKVDVVERFVGTGTLRLDELAPADFIKVDVDGAELDVLRSAGETLGRVSGLIVETHSLELERDCGRLLMDQGLRVRVVSQRGLWPDLRPIPHNRWLMAER